MRKITFVCLLSFLYPLVSKRDWFVWKNGMKLCWRIVKLFTKLTILWIARKVFVLYQGCSLTGLIGLKSYSLSPFFQIIDWKTFFCRIFVTSFGDNGPRLVVTVNHFIWKSWYLLDQPEKTGWEKNYTQKNLKIHFDI